MAGNTRETHISLCSLWNWLAQSVQNVLWSAFLLVENGLPNWLAENSKYSRQLYAAEKALRLLSAENIRDFGGKSIRSSNSL
jgi:hypothetical protein